jgi:hypothetical protein
MEEEFIPYELALTLLELGFDEECIMEYHHQELLPNSGGQPINNTELQDIYDSVIVAPLYQQAFKWFRKEHSLCSWVYQSNSGLYHHSILKDDRYLSSGYNNETTYEEAELACLRKLIEIVKKI